MMPGMYVAIIIMGSHHIKIALNIHVIQDFIIFKYALNLFLILNPFIANTVTMN